MIVAAHRVDERLATIVGGHAVLRQTSAGIASALPSAAETASDDGVASAYDALVGNPLYNRLVWGSGPARYTAAARAVAARAVGDASILDCGCGTLVFTAAAYRDVPADRLTLLDRSLAMLTAARRRRAGGMFLQGDALDLPFGDRTFATVMSWGMLHLFRTESMFLAELDRVNVPGGVVAVSSLVLTGRWIGNRMLAMLAARGEIAPPHAAATVVAAFAARFDDVASTLDGSMLTLTGRARSRSPVGHATGTRDAR